MSQALSLSTTTPKVNENVTASFKVKNVGGSAITMDSLVAAARLGSDWNGTIVDFPAVNNITLQPGQEYAYQQSRSFATAGSYFSEPTVKLKGTWGGIDKSNRVTFTVSAIPAKLQVSQALALSTTTPAVNQSVVATFKVKNIGGTAIKLDSLVASARKGTDWNGTVVDFPAANNLTLQPNQEYTYQQVRSFSSTGSYFAEPTVKINGAWGGIDKSNRVTFNVVTPGQLQMSRALSLSTTTPAVNQSVTATFKVKNIGGAAIKMDSLVAAARKGSDWNGSVVDFTAVNNITLQPGQEFTYQQSRSFATAGSYFSEPTVKINGAWGGIDKSNRVTFTVSAIPAKLQISQALALSTTTPLVNQSVTATFKVKNIGGAAVKLDSLVASARKGTDWNGTVVDFPAVNNITLQPGQEYAYQQSRSFSTVGSYFAEPTVKINGAWGGIDKSNRVTFNVVTPGQLQMSQALSLSTTSPKVNQNVTASFKVKNIGGAAIKMDSLVAAARKGSDWNGSVVDFPAVNNITLQPGQEYTYQQSRSFSTAGSYFSEPTVKLNGAWGGIDKSNRVTFNVVTPPPGQLQMSQALSLSTTSPKVNENVTACFKVKNVGGSPMTLDSLVAAARKGSDWSGTVVDFPAVYSITLQVGQEYSYCQSRSFSAVGSYFSEPTVKINGTWGGIDKSNRVSFNVETLPPGQLQMSQALSLSTTSPKVNESVTACFKVRNIGGSPMTLQSLAAGARKGSDWSGEIVDFPAATNIILQVGQEYSYCQSRSFSSTGNYFAEPVVQINGNWGGIDRSNRVSFTVNNPSSSNLALNKPSYAWSQESASYPPRNGNDGNYSTRWSSMISTTLGDQWWWVDLGSAQTFNRVVITWEAAYAKVHRVGWSDDGNTFYMYQYSISSSGTCTYDLGTVTHRYVGVRMMTRAPNMNNYSFFEFEVYRTGSATTSASGVELLPVGALEIQQIVPQTGR